MNFDIIREQIILADGLPGMPAADALFEAFESKYHVLLPEQVKSNYTRMNGSLDYTDGTTSWIRFWPLDEWRPAQQAFPDEAVANSLSPSAFVCADYALECVYFLIDLDQDASSYGSVFGMGATRLGLAAASFTAFIECVAQDSAEIHSYG